MDVTDGAFGQPHLSGRPFCLSFSIIFICEQVTLLSSAVLSSCLPVLFPSLDLANTVLVTYLVAEAKYLRKIT